MGPVGPRWALCWPHEPYCQGSFSPSDQGTATGRKKSMWSIWNRANTVVLSDVWNIKPIKTQLSFIDFLQTIFITLCTIVQLCGYALMQRTKAINVETYKWWVHQGHIICCPWWLHQMETFSALLAICADNSPLPGEYPTQKPGTRSFDAFFDLCPNKRLSKQSWGWWFEMPSHP